MKWFTDKVSLILDVWRCLQDTKIVDAFILRSIWNCFWIFVQMLKILWNVLRIRNRNRNQISCLNLKTCTIWWGFMITHMSRLFIVDMFVLMAVAQFEHCSNFCNMCRNCSKTKFYVKIEPIWSKSLQLYPCESCPKIKIKMTNCVSISANPLISFLFIGFSKYEVSKSRKLATFYHRYYYRLRREWPH